jgi:hypothetical protein
MMQQLRFITKNVASSHILIHLNGAMSILMVLYVVFGLMMIGNMKSGASGAMMSAGITMEHGKWDIDLK